MKGIGEAPGKVIISGEHFVVHGGWALAAAIGRQVRAEAKEADAMRVTSDRVQSRNRGALEPFSKMVEFMSQRLGFSPNVDIKITSGIRNGSGLGSSAAASVAVAYSLSALHSLNLTSSEVFEYSMYSESMIHGKPSGVDTATSANGGVIIFHKDTGAEPVPLNSGRSLIVAYSGRSRRTGPVVGKVGEAAASRRDLFSALTNSASEITRAGARALVKNDMKDLGGLMTLNQAALSFLGVSNEAIDNTIEAMVESGCYGAKLTGAGGGGSVVGVCQEGKEKRVVSQLEARGIEAFHARIPVRGARCWVD